MVLAVWSHASNHAATYSVRGSNEPCGGNQEYVKYVKKWLGAPHSLTNIAIHSRSTKLKLSVQSLVKEFKVAKARSFMTLRDSKDPVIKNTQPDVKTGRKWSADEAVEEAESRLKLKEMVGATQLGRQGLWWTINSQVVVIFAR